MASNSTCTTTRPQKAEERKVRLHKEKGLDCPQVQLHQHQVLLRQQLQPHPAQVLLPRLPEVLDAWWITQERPSRWRLKKEPEQEAIPTCRPRLSSCVPLLHPPQPQSSTRDMTSTWPFLTIAPLSTTSSGAQKFYNDLKIYF
ncbi:hypothetical protein GW17_00052286 [Ensete ventricosum]|nr:hypothetical protein GW17_00052286 [Ensete ventricosum]